MHYPQGCPDLTKRHETYAFPVAILRTSRLVYQEACAVLYSDSLLVLLDLDTSCFSVWKLFEYTKRPPLNIIDSEAPMPPATVHIQHEIEGYAFGSTCVVFAAADIHLVCHALHEMRLNILETFVGYHITVLKVPRNGWTSEKLSECIWKPLQDCLFRERDQVIDRTGVFETRAEGLAVEGPSDVKMDGKRDAEEDTEEIAKEDGGEDGEEDEDEDGDKVAEEDGDKDGE